MTLACAHPPAEPENPSATGPVFVTLAAVAAELSELALMSDQLQEAASRALFEAGAAPVEGLREFQSLDLLGQRLRGVAGFLDELAKVAPRGWRLDVKRASAGVTLSDLARRLSSAEASAGEGCDDNAHCGDLELFD